MPVLEIEFREFGRQVVSLIPSTPRATEIALRAIPEYER
jgi:hypothetical protein